MKARNILSKTAVKVTVVASCAVLLVGLGAFSALGAKATEGNNDNINIDRATEIALNDAKLTSSDVTSVKGTFEEDDGRLKYEIRFNADGKEYEYEINAKTGAIVDKSVEREEVRTPVTNPPAEKEEVVNQPVVNPPVESKPAADQPVVNPPAESKPAAEQPAEKEPVVNKPATSSVSTANESTTISADEAKSIALKDANVTDATFVKAQLDRDDGITYYDIEFNADGKEYDYEINAKTGAIIDKSVEKEEGRAPATNTPTTSSEATTISADEAKSIALNDANVTDATFVKAQLDRDDGVSYYEIEFRSNGYEYEYEISYNTGEILNKSVDREND